ncbi:MAG TPA: preprotein translocase subunit SecG [Oligella sp.]|nr:preprotein translocase subunit SecG [Oligella sp.]
MPSFLFPVLIVVQVVAAFAVIVLVMLQQGKGADMGSAFGGGSAGSVFGSAGAANFFSRMTKWAAVVFFATTLALAYFGSKSMTTATSSGPEAGLMEQFNELPVVPGAGAAVPPVAPGAEDSAVPAVPSAPDAEAEQAVPSLGTPEAPAVEETPAAQ